MAVERVPGGSRLIDLLDRVLDKGIVIDPWVQTSPVGIDLITVEARVVVASMDTHLESSDAAGPTDLEPRIRSESGESKPGPALEAKRPPLKKP